ncbi:LuxR C-terminal-related transcriptional regulator [Ornithinimicrobium sp. Y1847]|uniref:helix-turn-helix transcriptional regulator n=1 Tax=unclassified Ornithinimicrobium TaxID=2615080 RepID=UPI003B680F9B
MSRGEAYEEFVGRVYLTAVRLGRPTRALLLAEGLSDDEIDDAMAELASRGYLLEREPGTWEITPPRDAIARHLDAVERRLAISRATAAEVDSLWRRSVELAEPTHAEAPGLDLIRGVAEIERRILGLHRMSATRLWWAMDGSTAARNVLARAVEEPEVLAVREGVQLRVILDTSLLEERSALLHMERCRAAGHPVRVGRGVPFSAMVCDDTSALIDLSATDDYGDGSFEVRRANPIRAVGRLLEEVWTLSTPFEETVGAPGEQAPLGERDRRILSLLTSGAGDQLIARQVGVSVRTVERRVRYLMDHLGAATRFQAGVQAARRGWI